MDGEEQPGATIVGQLGHHMSVNLEGKTVGGVFCEAEQWVPGVIVGLGGVGDHFDDQADSGSAAGGSAWTLSSRVARAGHGLGR